MQSRQDSVPSGDPDVPDDGADVPGDGADVPGDGADVSGGGAHALDAEHTWPVDTWARRGASDGAPVAAGGLAPLADASTADLGAGSVTYDGVDPQPGIFGGDEPRSGFFGDAMPTASIEGMPAAGDVIDHRDASKPSVLQRIRTQARRPVLLVNLVLGVLILAGGGFAYASVADTGTTNAANTTGSGIRVPVRAQTVTQTASAAGTVASSDVVTANFTTSGTVTAIYAKLGQAVTKGQELARIDATAADEQLTTAKDNLTAAEDSLTRAQDSNDTTAIDSAQLQVDSAQDAVTSAQAAVDGVVLKAPISGTIIAQNGTVGASNGSSGSSGGSGSSSAAGGSSGGSGSGSGSGSAGGTGTSSSSSTSSGSGFMQIANLGKMEVDADFAEADATKLATGMPARVTWNALTGATATGKVTSIDPTATTSNNVVSYGVVVDLTTLPKGIRIGESTNVVVTTATKANVLAVPSTAVTGAGTNGVVTVYANGTTHRQLVGIGLVGDTLTEITSGLQAGDEVVLPTVTSTGTTTNPFGGGLGGGGFGGGLGGGGFGGGGAFTRGGGGGGGGGAGRGGGTGTGGGG